MEHRSDDSPESNDEMSVKVRPMRIEDVSRVSELSAELGYPVAVEVLERRFARIVENAAQALFVAAIDGRVAGWIHIHPQWLLESEPYAEIGGLVVSKDARRRGAGRALVLEAQRWARTQGLARLRVRSNINRQEAHQFYPALGFAWVKTQHNYELPLA
ncbi:MAG: GNAT family N-acetyltransferase [Myxococcales bacterium]|nr:GNAT family N-acetyltransferase [Myxococcales bacterium]